MENAFRELFIGQVEDLICHYGFQMLVAVAVFGFISFSSLLGINFFYLNWLESNNFFDSIWPGFKGSNFSI